MNDAIDPMHDAMQEEILIKSPAPSQNTITKKKKKKQKQKWQQKKRQQEGTTSSASPPAVKIPLFRSFVSKIIPLRGSPTAAATTQSLLQQHQKKSVLLVPNPPMGIDSSTPQAPPSESTELQEYPPLNPLRIRLNDGRYLAYIERGVPKSRSNYKIVIVHGFGSSKEMNFPVSQELIEKLGIYIVLYDRAGYGDSDMNAKRSVKSEAFDIEELANRLQLGSKFYVIGVSMGSYPAWSCLNYIPHRLAGVSLVVPTVNYRWPSLPDSLTKTDYRKKLIRWALRIASHAPGLFQWWVTQKWHPSDGDPTLFNQQDIEVLKKTPGFPMFTPEKLREKGVFETLRSDFKVGFGKWEFDPVALTNPFPKNEKCVHIWQGCEDKVVPFQLQRFISGKLPWINYHEIPDGGHLIVHYHGVCDAIVKALLLGEESLS